MTEIDNTPIGYIPDHILNNFIRCHNNNLPQARFKIGEKVKVNPDSRMFNSGYGIVLAVNDTGDGIEYIVDGWNIFFWEHELEKLK